VLCFNQEKEWKLIFVEGRKINSPGMKIDDLFYFLQRNQLCDLAINLDGGCTANMYAKMANSTFIGESATWWGKCRGIPRFASDILFVSLDQP